MGNRVSFEDEFFFGGTGLGLAGDLVEEPVGGSVEVAGGSGRAGARIERVPVGILMVRNLPRRTSDSCGELGRSKIARPTAEPTASPAVNQINSLT